jgi:hypothetical protein
MAESKFVGVVRDYETKEVLAIINPDDDAELDNPRWMLIKGGGKERAVELVRMERGDFMTTSNHEQLFELLKKLAP